jgi:hypothetical protein
MWTTINGFCPFNDERAITTLLGFSRAKAATPIEGKNTSEPDNICESKLHFPVQSAATDLEEKMDDETRTFFGFEGAIVAS